MFDTFVCKTLGWFFIKMAQWVEHFFFERELFHSSLTQRIVRNVQTDADTVARFNQNVALYFVFTPDHCY